MVGPQTVIHVTMHGGLGPTGAYKSLCMLDHRFVLFDPKIHTSSRKWSLLN